MAVDVNLGGAFLGGVLSFASPCVLPLVPPYLCFVAGVSLEELSDAQNDRRRFAHVMAAALAFVLGFATVFVALGATASVFGRLVSSYLPELSIVAGVLIIAMGLHFLGVFRIAPMLREMRFQVGGSSSGLLGAYAMGLAFAFGWTPCIGPVLAAILIVAGSSDTVAAGAGLLAVYALGLGVPFLLAAAFAGRFLGLMRRFVRYTGLVERVMGALLVVAGVLFLTGGMTSFSFWLLETFPALGRIG
jgi:cytochrome c-type biogenesis protein